MNRRLALGNRRDQPRCIDLDDPRWRDAHRSLCGSSRGSGRWHTPPSPQAAARRRGPRSSPGRLSGGPIRSGSLSAGPDHPGRGPWAFRRFVVGGVSGCQEGNERNCEQCGQAGGRGKAGSHGGFLLECSIKSFRSITMQGTNLRSIIVQAAKDCKQHMAGGAQAQARDSAAILLPFLNSAPRRLPGKLLISAQNQTPSRSSRPSPTAPTSPAPNTSSEYSSPPGCGPCPAANPRSLSFQSAAVPRSP